MNSMAHSPSMTALFSRRVASQRRWAAIHPASAIGGEIWLIRLPRPVFDSITQEELLFPVLLHRQQGPGDWFIPAGSWYGWLCGREAVTGRSVALTGDAIDGSVDFAYPEFPVYVSPAWMYRCIGLADQRYADMVSPLLDRRLDTEENSVLAAHRYLGGLDLSAVPGLFLQCWA